VKPERRWLYDPPCSQRIDKLTRSGAEAMPPPSGTPRGVPKRCRPRSGAFDRRGFAGALPAPAARPNPVDPKRRSAAEPRGWEKLVIRCGACGSILIASGCPSPVNLFRTVATAASSRSFRSARDPIPGCGDEIEHAPSHRQRTRPRRRRRFLHAARLNEGMYQSGISAVHHLQQSLDAWQRRSRDLCLGWRLV
jgi:hypothetical protein